MKRRLLGRAEDAPRARAIGVACRGGLDLLLVVSELYNAQNTMFRSTHGKEEAVAVGVR